jgi:hypothetical protein
MEKRIKIYRNEGEFNSPLLKIGEARRYIDPLIDSFNRLSIGHLTQEMVTNNVASSRPDCAACKGMVNFSSAESFVLEYQIDSMGGGATIGNGLKVGREQLKGLIQRPDPELLKPFERAFNAYKQKTEHIPLPAIAEGLLSIVDGQLVVNHPEVKARQDGADKYLYSPEAIEKFKELQQAANTLNSLNEFLTGTKSKLIRLDYGKGIGDQSGAFHAINQNDGKFSVNLPLAHAILSRL